MTEEKLVEETLSEQDQEIVDFFVKQHVRAQRTIAELRDHLAVLEAVLDDQITMEEAHDELVHLREKHRLEDGSMPSDNCPRI